MTISKPNPLEISWFIYIFLQWEGGTSKIQLIIHIVKNENKLPANGSVYSG